MDNIRLDVAIREEIEKLMLIAEGFVDSKAAAHTIERGIFKQLLVLGLSLLSYIFKQRISQITAQGTPKKDGIPLRNKGKEICQYLSLFGLLIIERPSYWDKDLGKIHPTDSELCLPRSSFWSYNIEEIVGESAAESDYKESVRVLNKLLNLGLSGKSSERNIGHIGVDVEAYYASKKIEKVILPVCFSASFDGKGVPKIKTKVDAKVESNPKKRLGKGEKKGIMEMATVSVTSSFMPKKRSLDSIICSLMGSPLSKIESDELDKVDKDAIKDANKQDNKWHKDIHRRAFLGNQNKAIEYGLNRIKDSIGNTQSRFVVPIDAGVGLEEKILAWVKEHKMEEHFDGIILDIIHVSEYVWDAATAIFGEKSRSKSTWVRGVLMDLLNSKTTKVIEDLKRINNLNNQNQLSDTKQKQVEKAITYFTNHQHKMDYKTIIEKGYPVSSALVEAACGHLVKERMEQSGMRWSSQGAQNIMDIRAVKLNDDMEDFMDFRIKKEQLSAFRYAA
jgi:hypothetical protein